MSEGDNNNQTASPTPDQSGSGGGGNSSGGRGRRNQRGGPRRGQRGGRRNQQWRPAVNPTTFEGREPTLKGHIYDLTGERNNDQYVKTTREIENWVGREYTKHVGDFCEAVSDLSLATPILPTTPASDTGADFEIWKLELKDAREKIIAYESFNARLYRIVLGQCSEALHDRLKSHTEFPEYRSARTSSR